MSQAEQNAAEDGWETPAPRFNLAILGGTGVGKSTLINAVFGQNVARTGTGEPVTKGIDFYLNPAGTLGLYDFEGAESFEVLDAWVKNFKNIYNERLDENPDDAIHGVWYCIKASDRRFDNNQLIVLKHLKEMGLPVILVVTQTLWNADLGLGPDDAEFLDHLRGRQLPCAAVVPVCAKEYSRTGSQIFGLEELLEATFRAAPEGVRNALDAAQRVSARRKRVAAQKIVAVASAAAAGVALTPIPLADTVPLVALQFGMLGQITRIYEVPLEAKTVFGVLTQTLAAQGGKFVASQLTKLVPVAGSAINASVASGVTWILGTAWLQVCEMHWKGEIDISALGSDAWDDLLKATFKQASRSNANSTE